MKIETTADDLNVIAALLAKTRGHNIKLPREIAFKLMRDHQTFCTLTKPDATALRLEGEL